MYLEKLKHEYITLFLNYRFHLLLKIHEHLRKTTRFLLIKHIPPLTWTFYPCKMNKLDMSPNIFNYV